jgi:hypothetical protein
MVATVSQGTDAARGMLVDRKHVGFKPGAGLQDLTPTATSINVCNDHHRKNEHLYNVNI